MKYGIFLGDVVYKKENAARLFNTMEEAEAAAESWKNEIIRGVYDDEWSIGPEDRQETADEVRAHKLTN